jgi:hypothetical protein
MFVANTLLVLAYLLNPEFAAAQECRDKVEDVEQAYEAAMNCNRSNTLTKFLHFGTAAVQVRPDKACVSR